MASKDLIMSFNDNKLFHFHSTFGYYTMKMYKEDKTKENRI